VRQCGALASGERVSNTLERTPKMEITPRNRG